MNSDERQLITGLFDRMRSNGFVDKDREADALISSAMRQNPDAGYLLVQSVLVQEHTLQQAADRIQDLEQRIADLENQSSRQAPQGASGGSFLGGLFGSGSAAPARSGASAAGRASAGFGSQSAAPQPSQPWGSQPAARQAVPQSTSAPWGSQPAAQQPAQAAQPAPAAGGGFMRQAMTTAAGVAGGMLAANALSSMFGGGSGSAQAGQSGQSNSPFESTTAQNDDADNMQEAQYSSHDNDPGAHDAGYDSGSDWGGDDIEV